MKILKVHWNCYGSCNLHCGFCYGMFKGHPALSTSSGMKILRKIKDEGVETFVFAGGDPLLRSDLIDLIYYAKELGLKVELQTNAHILNGEKLDILLPVVDCWGLSLDSAVEQVHDNERKGKGNYSKVINAAKYLIKKDRLLNIRTVISKRTALTVPDITEILRDMNFKGKWYLLQYDPLGDEKDSREQFEISGKSFDKVVEKVMVQSSKIEDKFDIIPVPYKNREYIYFLIAPDGSVYNMPSAGEDYVIVGNILNDDFTDLARKLNINFELHYRRYSS